MGGFIHRIATLAKFDGQYFGSVIEIQIYLKYDIFVAGNSFFSLMKVLRVGHFILCICDNMFQ